MFRSGCLGTQKQEKKKKKKKERTDGHGSGQSTATVEEKNDTNCQEFGISSLTWVACPRLERCEFES
jgi:hypothetical protein